MQAGLIFLYPFLRFPLKLVNLPYFESFRPKKIGVLRLKLGHNDMKPVLQQANRQ